jgi:hypothetical protein
MFRCERCRTRFTNQEARTLEYCPLCQEEGEQAPLVLKLFVGPLTEPVERTRQAMRELGGRGRPRQVKPRASTIVLASKLPAPRGRSTDNSEGSSASP